MNLSSYYLNRVVIDDVIDETDGNAEAVACNSSGTLGLGEEG